MTTPESELFEIAETQQGYFTFQQATAAGFCDKNHAYHIKTGDWVKAFRGIYRLAKYPVGEREELVLWFLWSRNRSNVPQGVYSHYTALDLYELSDNMPSKLHMTVPLGFRRMAKIPEILILHRDNLHTDEIVMKQGYKVTTPLRTLIDVLEDSVLSEDLLMQAVQDAKKKGLITKYAIKANQRCPAKVAERLLKMMEEAYG
ncbi:type IV toxin-antitoxin system AbiEi family antitoxin domain-containing protein [Neochlamydia sp. EPS4]|uniref:type IV toxin-antitoxin system AbiEi family antitoxin domain-containing protein n=1 Tax=Neochlamydia sp. EPS4 TaxID=1478175 RepID=UPI0005D12767|nr:type IV toxin-antitoxin system AbiEi family antitoxin domain-containing protein [Neochlamydia sp. EPS4]